MSTNELGITEETARFYIKNAYQVEDLSMPNYKKHGLSECHHFTTETGDLLCVEVVDGPRIVVSKKSSREYFEPM